MDITSPDIKVSPEPDAQKDAMKGMAQDILSIAQELISERRLDPNPKSGGFAWTLFGHELGKGYAPLSDSAIDLHEAATTGHKSSVAELESRIAQTTDPKAREELERIRDNKVGSLALNFDVVSDPALRQVYGNKVPNELVHLFAEKLGFIQPGERVDDVNNPRLTQGRYMLTVAHPDKPFILELSIRGGTGSGKPDIRSFVVRYTPK